MAEPPWMAIARGELGVKETPGKGNTPRVSEYLKSVKDNLAQDSIPWCAAFVSWVMQKAGYKGTGKLAARSWLAWGSPLEKPVVGCIVVLWREKPNGAKGHIGFFVREEGDKVWLLSGNSANSVAIRQYARTRLLGYRWPTGAAISAVA